MNLKVKCLAYATFFVSASTSISAADLTKAYDMADASKIIKADLFAGPTEYTMPKSCDLKDKAAIARGEYIFHNLNGEQAEDNPPEGLARYIEKKGKDGKVTKEPKQYGNCVACHNIEGAIGGGNIGPDLTNYKKFFIETQARDHQFVYQKIADPRVDLANTNMTVNLTTKLMSEQEICDLTAYVAADKSKKIKGNRE